MENIGVKIEGGKVDQEGVKIVSETILSILNSPYNDQATKQLALEVLSKSASAEGACNTTVNNCMFEMNKDGEVKLDEHYYDFEGETNEDEN